MTVGRHVAAPILICVLTGLAGMPGTALAHSVVVGSDPAEGATVTTPPTRLAVHFNEAPRGEFAYTRLTSGSSAVTTTTSVVGRDLVATVTAPLPDGAYTLAYRVASEDTHPVSGAVHFTVRRPMAPTSPTATSGTATAASSPSPVTASPTATASASADDDGSASDSADSDSDPSFWFMLFAGGLAAALAGWLVGRAARRPRRPR